MDQTVWIVMIGGIAAGFVQGMSGTAFGITAMAFWAWTLNPILVGPLVVFGSLIGQLLSIGTVWRSIDVRRVAPFILGGAVGVPLGVLALRHIDPVLFKFCVGLLLAIWCPMMLMSRALPRLERGGRVADAAVGLVARVMGGLGGLTGPAPTLWTALRGWERDMQRAVFQAFNLSMHCLTIAAYVSTGTVPNSALPLFAPLALAVMLSTFVGVRMYRRFSDATFRRMLFMLLTCSGLILIATTLPKLL